MMLEPEDESEIQVAEKLIKKIHLKAQTTEVFNTFAQNPRLSASGTSFVK